MIITVLIVLSRGNSFFSWIFKFNISFLHNEELHNLYSPPNIIRMTKSMRMRWAGQVARMGAKRTAYRILVGKPEGKRPLGRPKRWWMDNIKMDVTEI
jgi:hypothetical protein